ncbi:MAG: hypothetical protein K9N46_03710 [Candidatus Marinimicrobia bacterium]|nr:hypothetical protein [Candidatus Neomarinimicrobiota bacterium]MCF7829668.1 hypothetical protein [Candidatus Neomarinimicrobiota bacterium]MCF7879828.1 hypothetical protein [Candidatus Neomarinimicrobiota bacterium]
MSTRGYVTVAPYIHGQFPATDLLPGYRADFKAQVNFYRWDRIYLSGTTGNETLMHRPPDSFSQLSLDRLRYYLAPELRYQGERWFVKTSVKRESINKVSGVDPKKIYWWNSAMIGFGSRGSTQLHLRERYFRMDSGILNLWDGQINAGKFIDAPGTIWSARRHPYRYEIYGNLRYHVGIIRNWAFYATLYGHRWFTGTVSGEHKVTVTMNCLYRGAASGAGLFYTYVISDTFVPDNEDKFGALGIRIVF